MTDQPVDPRQVTVGFLTTEIEAGLTFAGLAMTAKKGSEKRERNRRHAAVAMATAERFLFQATALTPDDIVQITAALGRLNEAIAAIPD